MKKRYIKLENGRIFEGYAFGADASCVGELVFTTGVCGYLETLTDAAYYGQIVLQTFPMIGNYGVIPEDVKGNYALSGYVVRECCDAPSNFRCQGDLDSFLKEQGIPGVYGVDTRELTAIIRENGVMNAMICDDPDADVSSLSDYRITDAVAKVTSDTVEKITCEGAVRKAAVINFGSAAKAVEELVSRKCSVDVLPASVSAEELLSCGYDGVVLSGGPGDPAENKSAVECISAIFGKLPIFGIGLGHQLLAIAAGASTRKMKHGHRGGNHPVKAVDGTRTYISSQNHGYEVVTDSITEGNVSFVNANDGTCEGIDYPDKKAFSVQFEPDICRGTDTDAFLFDRFIDMMEGE